MGSLSSINCRGRVMKVPECVLIVEQGKGKTFDGNIKSVLLKHADCFGVAEILKFLVKHIKAINLHRNVPKTLTFPYGCIN